MVEKIVRQVEKIEKEVEESKLDLSLFKKRGKSKTFKTYLLQKMKDARKEGNLDVTFLIQHFYKKYLEFEEIAQVNLEGWKGKSDIKIITKPDKFIVITHQKPDQDSLPREIKREISKQEVNEVLICINKLDTGEKIPTREIGEMVYNQEWDDIFSDRYLHTQLNLIFRLLDYYKVILYRGGYSQLLNKIKDIQLILK